MRAECAEEVPSVCVGRFVWRENQPLLLTVMQGKEDLHEVE